MQSIQYGGKQTSVMYLVRDLEICARVQICVQSGYYHIYISSYSYKYIF